jgi:hypothetical protein
MALLRVETQQWFWDLWDAFELEFFYQYEYDNRPIDFAEKQIAHQQKMRKYRILLPEDPDTLALFDKIYAALNRACHVTEVGGIGQRLQPKEHQVLVVG